jgi:hypothetical protein
MAESAPSQRRHLAWVWVVVLGVISLVALGLGVTVVALLLQPAAPAATATATAPTPAPVSSEPAPKPAASAPGQQQQRYRAYVSAIVTNGTALGGAMAALQDCRVSRDQCEQRIAEASNQVDQFQRALSANPAPQCLSAADQRLRDGLSFQGRGLGLAEQAIGARNRVKMLQGMLLVTAGTWREGQAIMAARQSAC